VGFLSIMGKLLIGLSILILPVALFFTFIFSGILGTIGVWISVGASLFVFFCGLYAGFLGIKYEQLQTKFDALLNPLRVRPKATNLIKSVCPVDHQQVVFVHVSPHRDDARPDGLDIFVGSCGHEVHREEIEVEEEEETEIVQG
jgi:hypothetical protein